MTTVNKRMLKKYTISTNLLLILYSLLLLLSYFTSGNLLFEWIISFMPYFLVINVVIIIGLLLSRIFTPSHALLYIVTILMAIRVLEFAAVKPQSNNGSRELKVLFFNKLYDNINYDEIHLKIKEISPDIIGMAELKEKDKEEIAILKEYPYVYIKNVQDNASLALMSKYKFSIENSSHFSYLLSSKMNIDGEQYNVFVFHPLPPTSFENMKKRDEEIKKFSAHLNSLGNANVIAVGDFNVTPWSSLYRESLSQLKNITNTAKGNGIQTTYHQGLFRIPIDYIFVSRKFSVESFRSEYMVGSDHNLIWTIIKI